MTNYEKIKQMSVEELGELLDIIQIGALLSVLSDGNVLASGFPPNSQGISFVNWLESEVDNNA